MEPQILRYAAFSESASGGNPAGVVLDAGTLSADAMQRIAAEVGYSESAFVTGPITSEGGVPIRYFSPEGEVDFCGHATIATAAALADHVSSGAYTLQTAVGPVRIEACHDAGPATGTLESPPIGTEPLGPSHLAELLTALGWSADDLDPEYAPAIGTCGNRHPVLVLRSLEQLAGLAYDFATLQTLCRARNWITIQLVVPVTPGRWRSRNPFPWGGVVEDPATGSAAAGLAGYLRGLGQVAVGDAFTVEQGVEMGRPSRLAVRVGDRTAFVSGPAVPITDG